MKTIRIGLLMSLKQHSRKHESTQFCVCSSDEQSSQKFVKLMRNGMSSAMHASSVMTVRMREMNPKVCLKSFNPMSKSIMMASASDNIPMTNASRCGRGPLNSTDNHVIIVDNNTIDESR